MAINVDDAKLGQIADAPVTNLKLEPREDGDSGETLRLAAPDTGVKATWKAMGPGLAAAMTGIGSSHVMHGPTAGAAYGYILLWIIPLAYMLKYCAFEFAHRYTVVRGESVFAAYQRIGEGKGNWPLWYLGFQSFTNTFGIAGRALGCAAMLWAAFPLIPIEAWALIILFTSVGIIWLGQYSAVELVVKISLVVFTATTLFAFAVQAPAPTDYIANLIPALAPAGTALLLGAMFGYFPTTVEVAPMQSNWAVDKGAGMVEVKRLRSMGYNVIVHEDFMKNSMKLFHRDMNITYLISMVTGVMFLIMGAVILNPKGIVVSGREMGATLASEYALQFGEWAFPVIIAAGAAALYSTVLTYFDGQARVFEECAVRIKKDWDVPRVRRLLYRSFQIVWLVAGTVIILGMPRPILVVQIASVMALVFAPVIFWLNIRAFKYFEGWEKKYAPPLWMLVWAWVGVAGLAFFSFYVLYMRFFAGG